MRLAVFGDIHGNTVALEAVLRDITSFRPDSLICLGDVAAFGPEPRACLDLLRAQNCPVVMGNADDFLLHPRPETPHDDENRRRVNTIDRWCADQLTPADREFIASFKPYVPLPGGDHIALLAYHGSPLSYNDRITPHTPEEDLLRFFQDHKAAIYIGGHTHEAMLRRFRTHTIINPGSVGLPHEIVDPAHQVAINPARAEYAIIDIEVGNLTIVFRRVPFSLAELRARVKASQMPHADWWLADWVG